MRPSWSFITLLGFECTSLVQNPKYKKEFSSLIYLCSVYSKKMKLIYRKLSVWLLRACWLKYPFSSLFLFLLVMSVVTSIFMGTVHTALEHHKKKIPLRSQIKSFLFPIKTLKPSVLSLPNSNNLSNYPLIPTQNCCPEFYFPPYQTLVNLHPIPLFCNSKPWTHKFF